MEVDGVWYISVKGTAKAYEVKVQTIHYHIKQNPDIFDDHVGLKKIFKPNSHTQKYFMDKFAFLEIGTLLNNSPKIIPIKAWKSKLVIREVEEKLIKVIYIFQILLFILLSQY